MVRQNPNLSLTLPKNFVYHYKDGKAPKTPEQERPEFPEAPALSRNFYSARPTLAARGIFHSNEVSASSGGVAIPTIEHDNGGLSELTNLFEPYEASPSNLRASLTVRRFLEAPKTPSVEPTLLGSALLGNNASFTPQETVPEGCSDSSDATDTSDEEDFDASTNCTSPGYGSLDPFKDSRPSINPRTRTVRHGFSSIVESPKEHHNSKKVTVPWTPEMDRFLLRCFQAYCNDVTNTPFKHIPGCAPPLGACHRVVAMVKKLWRGGSSGTAGRHLTLESSQSDLVGGSTVTKVKSHYVIWPKSGASTRRRLRTICKRQQVMPTYYARLLHSQSPEPPSKTFVPHPSVFDPSSPFHEHYMRLAFSPSLDDSMQPDAPIARLTRDDGLAQPTPRPVGTAIPWASPAPMLSDLEVGQLEMQKRSVKGSLSHSDSPDLPRLASPFISMTWGPAATYNQQKPSTPAIPDQDITMTSPNLAPTFQNGPAFPDGTQKSRTLGAMERAMSPESSDGFSDTDLPGFMQSDAVRRARACRQQPTRDRASIRDLRAPVFNPIRASHQEHDISSVAETSESELKTAEVNEAGATLPRLASPFAGINARPSRSRRTLSTGSNGILGGFPSIEERLGGMSRPNPFS